MPDLSDPIERFQQALAGLKGARAGYHQDVEDLEGLLGQWAGSPPREALQTWTGPAPAGLVPEAAAAAGGGEAPTGYQPWAGLQSLLEASPSYVHLWCQDRQGHLQYANEAAGQAHGYPGLVLGRPLGEGAPALNQPHLEVLRTGRPSFGQVETLRSSDGPRWLRVNRHPMKDEQGRVVGVVAFGLDITELRQAEVSLTVSEQRYLTLFATMTEGLLLCELLPSAPGDPAVALIRDANPAFETMIGLPLLRLKGLAPGQVLAALDRYVRAALSHRQAAEAVTLEDLHLTDPDRCFEVRLFWPEADRLALAFNDVTARRFAEQRLLRMNEELERRVQGRTRSLEAAIEALQTEIAVRQQAEAALLAREDQFRLVADFTYAWEYWVDPEGRHLYDSPSCERVTGLSPQAFKDDPDLLGSLVHPEDRVAQMEQAQAAIGTRSLGEIEFRIQRADGQTRWVSRCCQPVFGAEGQYLGRRASVRDITPEKRQEQLQTARLMVLEELSGPATLEQCLRVLLEHLAGVFPEHGSSIRLLDPATGCLHLASSLGLPDFYSEAIEGLRIGPKVGSGGAACYHERRVVTEDLATDPNWIAFQTLTKQAGLGACWAEPILASTGQVLGVFSIYAKAPERPSQQDLDLLQEAARLGGLAIERSRSEATLRLRDAAMNAAANSIVLTDRQGRIEWVNAAYTQLTGYRREDALGRNLNPLQADPQDPELWVTSQAGKGWHGEGVSRKKDGSLYQEEQTITPILDERGELTHFIAIKQDITARKLGQEQLRKLSTAVNASPNGMIITDTQGAIEYVNPRFTEITGYALEELLGRNPRLLKSGLTSPELYQAMWAALGAGRIWRGELCNRKKDGTLVWEKVSMAPVPDEGGVVRHFVAVTEDVTEQRKVEQSLARLASAVDQAGEAVAILDLEHRILSANPAFHQILGLVPERSLGQNLCLFLDQPGATGGLQAALEQAGQGHPWQGRLLAAGPTAAGLQLEASVSPVRSPEGEICTLVAVLRDVTREAALDQHLRQVEKMDALGAMAGGIVHDFNNILTAILTAAELIEWQLEANSPAHAKLEVIYQAAHRAQALNRQIQSFSRKNAETRVPFDLSNVAREVVALLRTTLPENVALEMDLASSIWVMGDPGQLHQVLMNLIINGHHAMKDHGGKLRLGLAEVEVHQGSGRRVPADQGEGRCALITVSDTGCGMSPATLNKIFEPFFTTKTDGEGTGLGLSVVHGIVRKHGGSIQVASTLGEGTKFEVFIPCTAGQEAAPSEPAQEDLRGSAHILLVDDEDIVTALAKEGLQALGYRVTAKTSALDAAEAFRASPDSFDLLVTDLAMPELPGAELIKRLRKLRPDLPAIIVTGIFPLPEALQGRTLNQDELLAKPLDLRELAKAIHKVLARHHRNPAVHALGQVLVPEGSGEEGHAPLILLAEDSPTTRSLLKTWLVKGGFQVCEAKDGQDAWEVFCAADDPSRFSLVLTDLDMPRMNGLELVRSLRAKDPELPILILTASEDTGALREAMHLHVDEFLIKPFNSEGLLEHVNRLVVKRRFGMEAQEHAETAQAVRLAHRTMAAIPEQDLPIYSICEPLAAAGGDVFRCLRRPDGSVVLVLADVAGHSVSSSYAVASFLGMLSTFVQDWWGLSGLFRRLNQAIQTGPFPDIPIAVLAAHWEPRSGRLHVLNAGNPYGIWYRQVLGRTEPIALKGTPLGLFDAPHLQERVLLLEPGDRVLFGTDGLYDTPSPTQGFFREHLPQHWAAMAEVPVDEALGALCEAAKAHGQGRFLDDVLVVGLEQPPWAPAENELLGAYPSTFAAMDDADQKLAELLDRAPAGQGLGVAQRFDLTLALHEAMANAIEHGNGGDANKRVGMACCLTEETVLVRVLDEGAGFDFEGFRPEVGLTDDRGRGLPILRSIAQDLRMRGGELRFKYVFKGVASACQQ